MLSSESITRHFISEMTLYHFRVVLTKPICFSTSSRWVQNEPSTLSLKIFLLCAKIIRVKLTKTVILSDIAH